MPNRPAPDIGKFAMSSPGWASDKVPDAPFLRSSPGVEKGGPVLRRIQKAKKDAP
jgi:hypothetical protein